ncbi:RNA polymerase sigma factor [Nocardia sp. CA-119907]|uniref:RNA polymerase sigma factor n=1 Tax=Nocardia sp. CA-119907 TaxID=3239973 RepID=UPI003D95B737
MTEEYDQINLRTPPPLDVQRNLEQLHREQFSAFYRANIAKLVGFLVTQGARVADATDIAQDTMIQLWQSWSKIESPLAWARVVAGRELVRRYSALEEDHIDEAEYSALLGCATDSDARGARTATAKLVYKLAMRSGGSRLVDRKRHTSFGGRRATGW